jgi:hypothetical protein
MAETSTVDVDWDSTTDTWVLSNVNLSASVQAIAICSVSGYDCSTVSDGHSYGYKLTLNINHTNGAGGNFCLHTVDYTTTAVDDGFLLNLGPCTLGSAQTVNSQTWTTSDTGTFGCYEGRTHFC